ncbi:MAG: phosphoribosylanthranilate isomerase, partial [Chloroflexi bacterium]|nr:phosphoribosylanthranilate isomerase [Chloroflexota bacterium]
MTNTWVKLCGLRTPADAAVAAEAGADAIGLVFYPPSPRYLWLAEAQAICAALAGSGVLRVGVFVDERPGVVRAVAAACPLDLVQLHGDEAPEVVAALGVPAIKSLAVRSPQSLAVLPAYAAVARYLHLDAYVPGGLPGGNGQPFAWELAVEPARRYPVILAGGLAPENVGAAIAAVRPFGVDVSSGTERGGRKDHGLMRAFVVAVRHADAAFGESRGGRAPSGGVWGV